MPDVELDQVTVTYHDGTVALDRLSLTVRAGELFTVVGPSGCGKTALLRAVAGLDVPSHGRIRFGGCDVTHLRPNARDVAMVFQGDALYPHLTAGGNLRFGLEVRGTPVQEIDDRVGAESRVLGLWSRLTRRPATLSAGERQRVSLGRATVRKPAVFLLDEPLGHVAPAEQLHLRRELRMLIRGMGVTTILVTHDQEQAMALGDRMGVMRAGRLEQVGEPGEVYRRPANTFVAGCLGDPPMALLRARLEAGDSETWVMLGGHRLRLPERRSALLSRTKAGGPVVVGIRPEHVVPASAPSSMGVATDSRLDLVVETVQHRGFDKLVTCPVNGAGVLAAVAPNRMNVRDGDRITFVIDMAAVSFFDPGSGLALQHDA
jgi:multiple sugar transport system ATP-binding protein